MKKTLWTLSAIALLGFAAYACGEDDCDESQCAQGQECITTDLGLTYHCGYRCGINCEADGRECVTLNNGTSECMARCESGLVRDMNDGQCESGMVVDQCTTNAQCPQDWDCINNTCTPPEEQTGAKEYKFVRIDDLSATSKNLEDPGADIDSIVLIKKGTNEQVLPSEVIDFERADGTRKNPDKKTVAADPDIVKKISAFTGYATGNTDNCLYRDNGEYTFVSLGGKEGDKAGLLIVEMGKAIEEGDTLDVLEVGDCKLEGLEKPQSAPATADEIKITIAVSSSRDGDWKVVKDSAKASKGIISTTITAAMVPPVE